MKHSLFLVYFFILITSFICIPSQGKADDKNLPIPEKNEDGVYTQPWFLESFLDLREDINESKKQGKYLVILWEQRGCPYCEETHVVNLRVPEIVTYIKNHFNVLQLNLWGDREVIDVDGEVTTKKKLAKKYRIQFTPTMQFFEKEQSSNSNGSPQKEEIWRIMGYWKPFHFLNTFVYIQEKGYIEQPSFQRWLQAHAEKLRMQGKEINLW